MPERRTEAAGQQEPAFWYAIPHGYLQMDLNPPVERVTGLVRQMLGLPDEMRDRAEEVLRFYAGVVTSLNAHRVQACLLGFHPDDAGSIVFSVLTISTVPASESNAELVVASLAGTAADRPDEGMRPLVLPSGTGFLAERKRNVTAPGRPSEGSDAPPQGQVWQGTVALTGTGTSDIIMLQMVTSSVESADDYRNILLGVAHTVTFTDPSLPEAGSGDEPELGTAAASMRADFG
ncbi:hypothetical protein GCM10010145_66050 [Streptomyces ruber]|uniref:Uncharacterized protein n=2 Tax=Streptomyces TaxID=1883 RepID=A0A918EYN2_9ACTN|nr:hypothetical protein [Streptomyces ruber]GGQ87380.1 hypothetical protein GCM10010145_66050 [Streptomyces ruber]